MAEQKARKNRLPRTKTPEEWDRLFRCIDTRYDTQTRNLAVLYLSYVAALRIGETLALHTTDLDLDRLRVHVRDGKTGERNVPLLDDAQLKNCLGRWLSIREKWDVESPLLFVTKAGAPLHPNAVRRSMEVYGERSGLGHVTPHMLRHSAATEMLANGASPIGVQRVLGHRRLSTTLDVYASASDVHAAEAMGKRFRQPTRKILS
jgi:site-specific recombinase XerD